MDYTREQLVLQNMALARKLAYDRKRTLPKHIDVQELLSAAYIGLVESATRYDFNLGVSFTTFAYPRIYGAIHDYLRQLLRHQPIVSLDVPCAQDDGQTMADMLPAKTVKNDDLFEMVLVDLGEQAKDILYLYFVERFSMKEIGNKFGVSESRVSQMIKQYKKNIESKWTKKDLYDLAA